MLPLIIVIVALAAISFIVSNPPKVGRGAPPKAAKITVKVLALEAVPFAADISSYGVVRPRIQTMLSAQVSGQVVKVHSRFRDGGFFEQGDELLQLDDRDHRAELKAAQAALFSAQQALLEEQARVEQAQVDWQRLGNGEQASDLVLRKPQLETAKANVMSAQATVDKAKLDLERTTIKAPFSGRVLSQMVDLGQVVGVNTQLAEVYATDSVEVRLPIKNSDLVMMQLPTQYRDGSEQTGSQVEFSSSVFGEQHWQGRLVRTESAIDSTSQQLYVVGEISDPFAPSESNQVPIKIGQYVRAHIKTNPVDNAIVIPNSTVYQGSYVYTVVDGQLLRKDIKLGWQGADHSVVVAGLEAGEQLVLTPLGQVSSGTRVNIHGQEQSQEQKPNESMRKGERSQGASS
ncbi:efflux RND transporter periplasmic adaptor subunit [Pseudoalteromonas sp. GB56]